VTLALLHVEFIEGHADWSCSAVTTISFTAPIRYKNGLHGKMILTRERCTSGGGGSVRFGFAQGGSVTAWSTSSFGRYVALSKPCPARIDLNYLCAYGGTTR